MHGSCHETGVWVVQEVGGCHSEGAVHAVFMRCSAAVSVRRPCAFRLQIIVTCAREIWRNQILTGSVLRARAVGNAFCNTNESLAACVPESTRPRHFVGVKSVNAYDLKVDFRILPAWGDSGTGWLGICSKPFRGHRGFRIHARRLRSTLTWRTHRFKLLGELIALSLSARRDAPEVS